MEGEPSEESMVRYLLGDLPEEEQDRLERRLLSDDACYEELLALENELKYDYAQGGLTAEQRERFEKRFLRSPEERHGLRTARAVLDGISGTAPRPARKASLAALFPPLPRRLGWLMAAAAVLVSVGLVLEARRLQGRLDATVSDHAARIGALQKEASEERLRAERLREELEAERRQRPETARAPLSFVALSLTPGLSREPGSAPRRIVVPPRTESLRLELALRPSATYPAYRAILRSADGADVWRGDARAVGKVARLDLPARLLRAGDYELVLEGRARAGTYEEAGDYYFAVSPPN